MREEPSRAQSVGSGVMALDTGGISQELRAHPDWKDVVPSVTDAPTLGDGLRIAREHSGRSLAELSSLTRVPSRYLTALEQNDFSTLPNRVFSIGYVRAYAGSLGLDEQLAVERFKRESPDPSVPLQAPVGVKGLRHRHLLVGVKVPPHRRLPVGVADRASHPSRASS